MKKHILLILLFGVFVAGFAQQKNNNMETKTVFEKRLNNHIRVEQKLITEADERLLTTYLINEKLKKQTEIDCVHFKNFGYKHDEMLHKSIGYIDIPLPYIISRNIDVYLKNKDLFILQCIKGQMIFKHLTFSQGENFNMQTYNIGKIFIIGGHGSNISYYSENKLYENKLYFYTSGRFSMTQTEYLCYYDIKDNELNKIEFSETPKEIPDEKRIFREMDFEKPDSYMKISKAIESVLTESGKIKPNPKFTFKYLWCFDLNNYYRHDGGGVRQKGTTYFFYQEDYPYSKVKVIRYDNYEFTWLLDEYKEQIIESVK